MEKIRLGIFCFFDEKGLVDKSVEYLLAELKTVSNEMIVVVNGFVSQEGHNILKKYSDEIIVRYNSGYDMKAYEYALLDYLPENRLQQFDELILCNDTFFGPFHKMQDIFREMKSKEADFWGLDYVNQGVYEFIHSYFLVFRKRIIESGEIKRYFEENRNYKVSALENAVQLFEVGLSAYLMQCGFTWDTYRYSEECSMKCEPDMYMRKYEVPILKKKACKVPYFNYDKMLNCLSIIEIEYDYDKNIIVDYIKKEGEMKFDESKLVEKSLNIKKNKETSMSRDEFKQFLMENKEVYIYGAGHRAKKLWATYRYEITNFLGFVISDDQFKKEQEIYGNPVFHLSEIDRQKAIVVAMTGDKAKEIEKVLCGNVTYINVWNENV